MTSLGLDERLERVLAYLFGPFSGLFFFLFEKNRNVRWHGLQSIIVFGALSIVMFGISMLKGMLGWLPVLHILTDFGLGLLLNILWWVGAILWGWLMVMAWMHPDYRLPLISQWVRHIV
ncbi:DUF4870 domain-containing protein [Thermosporothrix hazakensis]|uniref:Membrane protein n=2 Tax=Thermosporothrix TaxID=768650 RepID=A0A455SU99_9CHLR|nr:hypothetical protein [Thermosporothrix hazakensis]BBH90482.1 membrane protein [Thermosporothrix sp. COM3]